MANDTGKVVVEVLPAKEWDTKCPIPEGRYGKFLIRKHVVPTDLTIPLEDAFHFVAFDDEIAITELHEPKIGIPISPRTIWMSDTPMEIRTCSNIVDGSYGDVLVVGLGLGIMIQMLEEIPEVKSISVVEREKDIINMNMPYLGNDIIVWRDDARKFYTHQKYDTILVDIYPTISHDNIPLMNKVDENMRKLLRPGGEIRHWSKSEIANLDLSWCEKIDLREVPLKYLIGVCLQYPLDLIEMGIKEVLLTKEQRAFLTNEMNVIEFNKRHRKDGWQAGSDFTETFKIY